MARSLSFGLCRNPGFPGSRGRTVRADYTIPAGRIQELNRNIVGKIEVVARAGSSGSEV
jgi:hypothetical protein